MAVTFRVSWLLELRQFSLRIGTLANEEEHQISESAILKKSFHVSSKILYNLDSIIFYIFKKFQYLFPNEHEYYVVLNPVYLL